MIDFPKFPELEAEGKTDAPAISFNFEDVVFEIPSPEKLKRWLEVVATSEGKEIVEVCYVFCSDEHLLEINRQHLQHDYYTDVITFPFSETEIHGDIFISIDRVRENAQQIGVPFEHELKRIMVHGLLHLAGHSDKTAAQRKAMTQKEDFYLNFGA